MVIVNRADKRIKFGNPNFQIKSVSPGINMGNSLDYGLYQLGRFDHTLIKGGTVVKMHPHKNDEILSYIRKGKMTHEDSNGNIVEINNSYLMMMNSGSGIFHEETVPENGEDVEMIQIFIRPEKDDLEPRVQFHKFENVNSENDWRLVGGNSNSSAPLIINSDILVKDIHLTQNTKLTIPEHKIGLLYVFAGDINANDEFLEKGDSIVFNEDVEIEMLSPSDLVYFEMDKNKKFTRSGPFSGMN